ncbi:hypothetical protein [Geomicrobium sediminis]|uniref:DUF1634 domain-containing protein n=1 Tax=Geomicrobium sediminis TaxID=1347788 RepID=A0ABS2PCV4_9BACL|nr:hypothetical protein [Geomicrobium sediminis]MBM7633102.1 hypothetical protein [Geomicrobium sediminis]
MNQEAKMNTMVVYSYGLLLLIGAGLYFLIHSNHYDTHYMVEGIGFALAVLILICPSVYIYNKFSIGKPIVLTLLVIVVAGSAVATFITL